MLLFIQAIYFEVPLIVGSDVRNLRHTLPVCYPLYASQRQDDVDSADHILGLALSVFRTDAVLLHLRDKDEVLAKSANPPAFKPGTCAAMCRILEPPPTEMSVVEDPQSDPR